MNLGKSLVAHELKHRFRGFLPVVVDIETAGVNPFKNALLEVCVVLVDIDSQGCFFPQSRYFEHVLPFEGSELDEKSLEFIQVDPFQPLRFALEERQALRNLYQPINKALKEKSCLKAVLVGHNAWFDLLFLKEATKRSGLKFPFHSFTCFDTATLAGLMYGQTVLSKAAKAAGIPFNAKEAHSAIYDAEKTAELFCAMLNAWRNLQDEDYKSSE
ncbi:ribonuclease T [Legionella jordanis]|uniref:Ribonuclease T n=1 Tax=Legionella jordanis TaxID=456 RepID=A0A0W0VCZ5_9GAMM|nr:ribonuclease T [Legionella jordanis]KTD18012.1 ribonuclease T [Legionella jordanis]RMX02299.1 ribonuclease T [Legionella jordanis]RMX21216.1 ribonuclease T [Legionella jordanis]VEH13896.1 ribonuclease T [Legionella jordanis]HAT8714278.1 ribonuclease T [Legionella jordanis]